MSGEYLRIQIYFPVRERNLYRAIETLADTRGVSMSHVAREGLREWLNTEKVVADVLEASSEMSALEYIRNKAPCRHRSTDSDGLVHCRATGTTGPVSLCVECEAYEPR